MFTPAISKIADSLETEESSVIGATTGFVVTLGLGPLILAPMSETFGRRNLYLICFSIFTLLQIPTALSPNVGFLIAFRTMSGFFGSVGIANGGGTISDMFEASERGGILGWYLLGPLLGPTLGPLFGGLIAGHLDWRWIFWITTIICACNTTLGFLFLRESYRPKLLSDRCDELSKGYGGKYTFPGYDPSPMSSKLWNAAQRPIKLLLTQPIVITMAMNQAIIFATMYTLYTNMQEIYRQPPYNMSISQVGCLFLFPGAGFLLAAWFVTPQVDTIYNRMTEKNNDEGKPEFRLPLATAGAIVLPISMIWFAWTVEYEAHWLASISSTVLFGLGQVAVFSTVQNYYIDAFSKVSLTCPKPFTSSTANNKDAVCGVRHRSRCRAAVTGRRRRAHLFSGTLCKARIWVGMERLRTAVSDTGAGSQLVHALWAIHTTAICYRAIDYDVAYTYAIFEQIVYTAYVFPLLSLHASPLERKSGHHTVNMGRATKHVD